MAVTPDGLRCQSREQKEWHGCRANKGIAGSGKYFFEAIVTDEGLCRVGWSTSQANIPNITFINDIIFFHHKNYKDSTDKDGKKKKKKYKSLNVCNRPL